MSDRVSPVHTALLTPPPAWLARAGRFAPSPLAPTVLSGAAFVCGGASAVMVKLVGEIYVGELLLTQMTLIMILLGRAREIARMPAFGTFIQAAVLMLLGYMLSDLYRDASPAQFLRGWAKVGLLTFDFIALIALTSHDPRNLWWFVLGMAVGQIVDAGIREVPIFEPAGWKVGYGVSVACVAACLCAFAPIRIASLAFALMGVWNIYMDYRILGAICVLLAAVMWMRSTTPERVSRRQLARAAAVLAVAAGIIGATLLLTQDDFAKRREQSNAGRTAALGVALIAISESPLVGYGSWPKDVRLVDLYHHAIDRYGSTERDRRVNVFVAHSQVLQGWVEGGVLALFFWLYYGYWLVRCGVYVAFARRPDRLTPLYLLFVTCDLWHLAMSPFAGTTRFSIAIGIAIICACAAEQRAAAVHEEGAGA